MGQDLSLMLLTLVKDIYKRITSPKRIQLRKVLNLVLPARSVQF